MFQKHQCGTLFSFVVLVTALLLLPAVAAEVPSQLPDPDGKPGDATKPVKVYITTPASDPILPAGLSRCGSRNRSAAGQSGSGQ